MCHTLVGPRSALHLRARIHWAYCNKTEDMTLPKMNAMTKNDAWQND